MSKQKVLVFIILTAIFTIATLALQLFQFLDDQRAIKSFDSIQVKEIFNQEDSLSVGGVIDGFMVPVYIWSISNFYVKNGIPRYSSAPVLKGVVFASTTPKVIYVYTQGETVNYYSVLRSSNSREASKYEELEINTINKHLKRGNLIIANILTGFPINIPNLLSERLGQGSLYNRTNASPGFKYFDSQQNPNQYNIFGGDVLKVDKFFVTIEAISE